ncbi:MAG: hypothetical protein WAQ28_05030 [Bacteroidia bacterium]
MGNYQFSENGHTAEAFGTKLAKDITETMNQAYKRQMEMSAQFYNRIFDMPVLKDNSLQDENFWGLRVWQNNMSMAKHSLDTYTNWAKQMGMYSFSPAKKKPEVFSKDLIEKFIDNYERQIQEIKEFNALFIDSLTNSSHITFEHTSRIIENFKKSTENNLDLFMHTVKGLLQPANQNIFTEITKEIDAITKLNFEIWADLVEIMGRTYRADAAAAHSELKEQPKASEMVEKKIAKPVYKEYKANKHNVTASPRVKSRVHAIRKK